MSEDTVDLGQKLDDLADKMLEAAVKDDVKLSDRLEVFKILSAHYVNTEKVKGKKGAPVGEGPTMGSLKRQIDGDAAEGDQK